MARASVSKSRGVEKSRTPAIQAPVATQEIVPGKFSEADWSLMLDRDGSQEYIAELVDELINSTMGAIFKCYLERQLFPFTISQAKDAIVEIIEWYFLAPDDGERNISSDLGWAEDEEPETSDTDCWAQGSIPKSIIAAKVKILAEIPEVSIIPEVEEACGLIDKQEQKTAEVLSELLDVVSDTEDQLSPDTTTYVDSEAPTNTLEDTVKQREQRSHSKRKSSFNMKKLINNDTSDKKMHDDVTDSVDKPVMVQKMPNSCSSLTKVMFNHPAGAKDALYDEVGNVLAVPKLDADKLPTHKVNVKYIVIDTNLDSSMTKVDLKKRHAMGGKQKHRLGADSNEPLNKVVQGTTTSSISSKRGSKNSLKVVQPTIKNPVGMNVPLMESPSNYEDYIHRHSMFDEMELSQGITIKEGPHVRKEHGRYYGKLDILDNVSRGMKPINLKLTNPGLTVADILDRQTPILRPFRVPSPLPPIVLNPQQQAKRVS